MKKELSGDYLAPEIEVIQMQIRQTVLAGLQQMSTTLWAVMN